VEGVLPTDDTEEPEAGVELEPLAAIEALDEGGAVWSLPAVPFFESGSEEGDEEGSEDENDNRPAGEGPIVFRNGLYILDTLPSDGMTAPTSLDPVLRNLVDSVLGGSRNADSSKPSGAGRAQDQA